MMEREVSDEINDLTRGRASAGETGTDRRNTAAYSLVLQL